MSNRIRRHLPALGIRSQDVAAVCAIIAIAPLLQWARSEVHFAGDAESPGAIALRIGLAATAVVAGALIGSRVARMAPRTGNWWAALLAVVTALGNVFAVPLAAWDGGLTGADFFVAVSLAAGLGLVCVLVPRVLRYADSAAVRLTRTAALGVFAMLASSLPTTRILGADADDLVGTLGWHADVAAATVVPVTAAVYACLFAFAFDEAPRAAGRAGALTTGVKGSLEKNRATAAVALAGVCLGAFGALAELLWASIAGDWEVPACVAALDMCDPWWGSWHAGAMGLLVWTLVLVGARRGSPITDRPFLMRVGAVAVALTGLARLWPGATGQLVLVAGFALPAAVLLALVVVDTWVALSANGLLVAVVGIAWLGTWLLDSVLTADELALLVAAIGVTVWLLAGPVGRVMKR